MRKWIDIFETKDMVSDVPHWFINGKQFGADQWERATDFLDPDEFNYDWRLCEVPLNDVVPTLLVNSEERANRIAEINTWLDRSGNPKKMLNRHPPLALLTTNGLQILDGNHRIAVAQSRGFDLCQMLVGLRDDRRNIHETPLAAAHAALDEINPDDVGNNRFGNIILYFEGFGEDCWNAYHDRVENGEINDLADYEREIVADWQKRIGERTTIVETGWSRGGEEDEPGVFFAIFTV